MSSTPDVILGVDPGKMTGLALYEVASNRLVAWESTNDDALDWCRQRLESTPSDVQRILVACELFVVTVETAKKATGDEMWSIEAAGVLRHLCRWTGHTYDGTQTASAAKRFASNRDLRSVGWYVTGGKGHHNDAIRHVVLARARTLRQAPPWV